LTYEETKIRYNGCRERIVAALEKSETPEAQITASEDMAIIFNKTTQRWSLAPFVEVPSYLVRLEIPTVFNLGPYLAHGLSFPFSPLVFLN
jgi:hypothetical protein